MKLQGMMIWLIDIGYGKLMIHAVNGDEDLDS